MPPLKSAEVCAAAAGDVDRLTRRVANLRAHQFLLTLETNRDPPSLMALFDDLLQQPAQVWARAAASVPHPLCSTPAGLAQENAEIARTATAVMSVAYHGKGGDATVLVSKKGGASGAGAAVAC